LVFRLSLMLDRLFLVLAPLYSLFRSLLVSPSRKTRSAVSYFILVIL
jgi:hypothetical protein